ncbi:tetratricopeptide repeat protein [Amaricoccus solimangrovi]|uniref:Tetratricopeptide repeat protein n=1 Tax=Amaricoccus solimangrovi TaxID=2589815 RepID=A0A501WPA6_9RHOB|nr:tetratricopeptide repeat protein [Amaricoccus solimangrovi]TPE48861.1 tetratricopeptide repeat protein [Amaricoccus solimangrovi]
MPTINAKLAAGILSGLLAASPLAPALASSLSGAYLAAMQADFRDDYPVAAEYYDRALATDPTNFALMQNALVARVALGDMEIAGPLADKLAQAQPENQLAGLVRLAAAIHDNDFDGAARLLASAPPRVYNPLLAGLVAGWIEVGREDFPAAKAKFDAMTANDAMAAYGQYHKALALAMAGDFVSAETILAGGEQGPLHLTRSALIAHAEILAQLGKEQDALAMLNQAIDGGFPDATLIALRDRLARGDEVAFDQVTEAKDGVAEAYLTLAEALNTDNTERVALLHARLAAYIRPGLIEADLLAAELLENEERYALATEVLSEVPEDSPWYVTAEIRRASTQRDSGDVEGGIATLVALAATHGDQIEVQSELGDAYRSNEQFGEAVAAYTKAIDLIGTPQKIHWVLYYTRGVANERAGDWAAAEADFREALKLSPDQPLVLNYLGYSLLEQGQDYDEALDMIQRAVKGQPDDGYITDSLGWAYYRLGRYQDAVAPMLRAVELTPDDPVINDHLGDVLWMVGRKREADFQWHRALSFGPADDLDMDRIRRKLDVGLDKVRSEDKPGSDG